MIRNLLLAGVLALVACLVVLNITSCSMSTALKTLVQEDEKRRDLEWQQLVIYDIFERRPDGPKASLSEAAIKMEYVNEAGKWKSGPPKGEPSDEALKRILLEMIRNGHIERTPEGEYVRWRSIPPVIPNDPALPNK